MANEGIIIQISKRLDLFVPVAVIGIILVMILPVHPFLLDIFLTLSISLSVMILFVSIYVEDTLDFSTFPSVLLIVTLFRLALNIATTRRILLYGAEGEDAAGSVIMAFGQFVVGGDFVVGLIIFIILVIINFVVITKGSGRVAEVAARFTLDAMPGKQMSIDADLNAGIIDDKTARRLR
ncbi:FHIPEP family type III secretion protein, partial [Calditerrivibrio sp.]